MTSGHCRLTVRFNAESGHPRVPGCKTQYGEVNFAFQKLIEPHVDQNLKSEVLGKTWVPDNRAPPPRVSDLPLVNQGAASRENIPQSLK